MTRLTVEQIDEIRQRVERIAEIQTGALPTIDELKLGYPFCKLSEGHDRRIWLGALQIKLPADDRLADVRNAIELAIGDGSTAVLRNLGDVVQRAARDELIDDALDYEVKERVQFYAAIGDDRVEEHQQLIDDLMPIGLMHLSSIDMAYRYAFAVGLQSATSNAPEEITGAGLDLFKSVGEFARLVLDAEKQVVASALAVRPLDVDLDTVEDIVEQVSHAGFLRPKPTGVVVIPAAPDKPSGPSRDIWKSVSSIVGSTLPLADAADLTTSRSTLTRRYPHLVDEIDIALRASQPLRLLLVGEPGCGKTSLGRSLAEALGLHSLLYSAAGAMDSSFGGTSSQWNSARMSVPLQLIARSRCANPAVIIDELDKTGTDNGNGSMADVLLGFLEPQSARRMMDLALEVEVDLSHVGYIATANRIEDVPSMLRDRLKIIRVPLPDPTFLPALSEHVLNDIATLREIDRRWLEPLATDELELVGNAWESRSLRQLRRLVEIIVNGRELLAVRS